MRIARAISKQDDFFAEIAQVPLPPRVVSITPRLDTDWYENDFVFFHVVLEDDIPLSELTKVTDSVRKAILARVHPLEDWDVLYAFRFMTVSEKAHSRQPVPA